MRAVDLFAGGGGMTSGAEAAGVSVVWAANHWQLAVDTHARNHPGARHACQDLRQADWTTLPAYDLLLAAPACQGHSTASQPRRRRYHDALRATAMAVVDCADMTEPTAIVVENVPAFLRWRLYGWWREGLERLGYTVTEQIVTATDHGVPQRRDRLFVVATRGRAFHYQRPVVATEPAFGPCVDWRAGTWRPVASAGVKAQARMRLARDLHGRRVLSQHVTGHKGVPLSEAIRTITCQDQWAVVNGDKYRPLTIRETARGMGFDDAYQLPEGGRRRDAITMLGNAVCPPVARDLITQLQEQIQ